MARTNTNFLVVCFLCELDHFDENKMTLIWMKYVGGETIFPKLPHQLRLYHKQWERNRRVQSAVENMKSDLKRLEIVNEEQMPVELGDMGAEAMDWETVGDTGVSDGMVPEHGLLHYPGASMLLVLPPTMQGICPDYRTNQVCVGLERIGGHFYPGQLPPLSRYQGNRGQDKKKQQG
jgi:hypothetical protein